MVLVDANVIIDVWQKHPEWWVWSVAQLRAQSLVHELAINPVVYAELALSFDSMDALDREIGALELTMREPPRAALFLAGHAFRGYRRAGGTRTGVLSDFVIGAHAAVLRCGILTRGAARYRTYFPTVELLTPRSN